MITNETLETIKHRRSIRSYKDEQITDGELQAILEAGTYAPNAGDQAWHFTVVQNRALLDRLNLVAKEAAKQSNIPHLRRLGEDDEFNCLYGAPTLVIVSGDSRIPIPLDADCAAATQNLLLAAESLGLGGCWIYFVLQAFNSPEGPDLRSALKIPEGYRPYFSVVLGHKTGSPVVVKDRKHDLITYVR